MDKNFEILKEKVKFETEKFKYTLGFIVILTGGLISLALNDTDSNFKDFLIGIGIIIDFLASFYLVKLNSKINNLIKKMEDRNHGNI